MQNFCMYIFFQSVFMQLNDLFSDWFSVIFHRYSSAQDPDPDSDFSSYLIESITASITAVSQSVTAVLTDLLTEVLYNAASDSSASALVCAFWLDPAALSSPYMMNCMIGSVHDLWWEWIMGLGSGLSI